MSMPPTTALEDEFLLGVEVPAAGSWQMGDAFLLEAKYPDAVRILKPEQLLDYLLKTWNLMKAPSAGQAASLPVSIERLPVTGQRWLLYAMLLMATNKKTAPEFDYQKAVDWLARNVVETGPAALHAVEFFFEFQVLGRTGWLAEAMHVRLAPLSEQERQAVRKQYEAPSRPDIPKPDRLNPKILDELRPVLDKVLLQEIRNWMPPEKGQAPAKQPIDQLRTLANWIQFGVWRGFEPHVAACPDGPFVQGFRYGDKLYDKTTAHPTEAQILGYVLNRMEQVGVWDGVDGSIYLRAGYDGSRSADCQELEAVARRWLSAHDRNAKMVQYLVQHTGSAAHGTGCIGVVTDLPFTISNAQRRWQLVRTLIHELGHILMHPALRQAARTIPMGQVVLEGFVEVMTRDLYNKIVDTMSDELKDLFLDGIADRADPVRTEVGYGQAGKAAAEIHRIAGRDRFFMAFFNGDLTYVGLDG